MRSDKFLGDLEEKYKELDEWLKLNTREDGYTPKDIGSSFDDQKALLDELKSEYHKTHQSKEQVQQVIKEGLETAWRKGLNDSGNKFVMDSLPELASQITDRLFREED